MKKILLLILLIPYAIFAEDIYFKVIETTPAWVNINFPKPDNISGEIKKGNEVVGVKGIQFSSLEGVFEDIPFQVIQYNNKRMLIYASSVIPLETQDLFDDNILYNPDKPLIFSLYVNALLTNNRELIYLHNKLAWDKYVSYYSDNFVYIAGWWEHARAHEGLKITQTALTFNSTVKTNSDLLIKSIKKTKDGYILKVKESTDFSFVNNQWNWSNPKKQEVFTILLVHDGDYIDLYLENKNNLIDTFVFVNKELILQADNLILGYPVNLTNISLPRRADGSTDYPPPALATDTNNTEETENNGYNATAEFTKEKPANKGSGFKIIMIAGIAVLLGGGAAVFVLKMRK
jgi:hypothetical protein